MSKIVSKKWKQSLVEKFIAAEQLRIEDKFCDITLQSVDKVNVRAHKIILITGSNYFSDLFSSEMKESYEDCIEYKLIKGDVLEKVISFIYTGELDVSTKEKIEEIAVCANYFQLHELIDGCMKLLSKSLDDNNCLKYWRLSNECFHNEFKNQCISHIFDSPSRIYETESFFNILEMDEVEVLLKDVRLNWLEEKKLDKILQWTKLKTNTKEEFGTAFANLMESIDFTSINKDTLSDVLIDDDLLEHKNLLKDIVKKSKNQTRSPPNLIKPEKRLLTLLRDEIHTISFDGNFTSLVQKRNSLRLTADTTFNNFLFICGGKRPTGECINTCEYFDPFKKEWKYLPSMPTSRECSACIFLEDKIYVVGGYDGGRLSTVEIFDIKKEKWSQGKNLRTARNSYGLVSINQSLYAVSGYGAKNIEMFDPRAGGQWTEVYNGFEREDVAQCVSIDSDIYCFHDENKPEIFDTKMNTVRDWKGSINYISPKKAWSFKVCILNDGFNFIQWNSSDSSYIDFYKYDYEGDLVSEQAKAFCLTNGGIGALAALNY